MHQKVSTSSVGDKLGMVTVWWEDNIWIIAFQIKKPLLIVTVNVPVLA
jgi:hypothetical protein